MSEKSKMTQQLPYRPDALSLVAWRNETGRVLSRYNRSRLSEFDRRNFLLKNLIHAKGFFQIRPPFYCSYGSHTYIGRDFNCGRNALFHDAAYIRIGDYVQIGHDVKIITSLPVKDAALRKKHVECAAPITIGDNVYIGNQVVILPGVTIGSGSIIMDGSIVYEDVNEKVVAGGNPCVLQNAESEACLPFQDGEEVENPAWYETCLDKINLEYVDRIIHAIVFAGGVVIGCKVVLQAVKKYAELEEQKDKIEKYLPLISDACPKKKQACGLRRIQKNKGE